MRILPWRPLLIWKQMRNENYKTSGKYRRCQQNVISVAVTLPLRCCRAALCVTDKSLSDLNHWMRSVNDTARSNLLRLAEQLVVEFFRETNTARVLHPITSRLVALFPLNLITVVFFNLVWPLDLHTSLISSISG